MSAHGTVECVQTRLVSLNGEARASGRAPRANMRGISDPAEMLRKEISLFLKKIQATRKNVWSLMSH